MKTPAERLITARQAAGYESAADAARALNMKFSTYAALENGQNGLSRSGERLAQFFRVDLNWLLTGRGEMRGKRTSIPIMGVVAAGSSVVPVTDSAGDPHLGEIDLPERGRIAALIVKGDSMYPRFMDGERILYDPAPINPTRLFNSYAVAQTLDGRIMIKMLKPGRTPGRFILWSHNAPDEEVEIMACHRVLGMLTC
ncbi:MAG: helix-turn-helix transcriptional regulator [Methylobacterium sp.]|jgi:phage repressor protein C with HTH and peptisase S24 domain|nr:helix-turn-helix transcriptional regulator [Methylobacterium sp.]MCA3652996.1 helix-turn-helix transcriptional regulator [Methylobacterium sp.]